LPNTEYWDYDYLGRVQAHTDYKDQTTGYFYNTLGRLEYKRYYQTYADYTADPDNNWKVCNASVGIGYLLNLS